MTKETYKKAKQIEQLKLDIGCLQASLKKVEGDFRFEFGYGDTGCYYDFKSGSELPKSINNEIKQLLLDYASKKLEELDTEFESL